MEQIGEAWDRIERALAGADPICSAIASAPPTCRCGRLADLVFVRPAVRRALEQNQPAA